MRHLMLFASVLLPSLCVAQEPALYDGSWEVQLAGTVPRVVSLTLKDGSGSLGNAPWVSGKFGQCFSRSMPVTVTLATTNELAFEVTRSKVIPGCPDTLYKLTRTSADRLEGTSHREDVTPDTNVTLVRK